MLSREIGLRRIRWSIRRICGRMGRSLAVLAVRCPYSGHGRGYRRCSWAENRGILRFLLGSRYLRRVHVRSVDTGLRSLAGLVGN